MKIEMAFDAGPIALFWILVSCNIVCLLIYAVQIHHWIKRLSNPQNANQPEFIAADPTPRITAVIPCRNEAKNLLHLLQDLAQQTQSVEVLVIDDHSTDDTREIAESVGVSVILNPGQGKKAALRQAHGKVKTPWMATLDADVRIGADWAQSMIRCIQENQTRDEAPQAILGTVCIQPHLHSAWERFQALEYACLMAWIEGGVMSKSLAMGSGANSVYRTSAYPAGQLHEERASGDDAYALLAIKQRHGTIVWNPDSTAVATTQPVATWPELWHQRARWASKITGGSDGETKKVGWTVAAVHLMLLVFIIVSAGFGQLGLLGCIALFGFKAIIDQRLIRTAAKRYALPWRRADLFGFTWRCTLLVWGSWWHLLTGRVKWKGRPL
jgi:cellulose synthase/poly-beta-1,6-N-acetylglucosamine synthase-like glycosyltransferase